MFSEFEDKALETIPNETQRENLPQITLDFWEEKGELIEMRWAPMCWKMWER